MRASVGSKRFSSLYAGMITETSGRELLDFAEGSRPVGSEVGSAADSPRLDSGGVGLIADDFVALDHGRYAHPSGTIVRPPIDPHNFAHRADEHFGTARDLCGQRQRDVQFAAG